MNSSISSSDMLRVLKWDLLIADFTSEQINVTPEWGVSDCLMVCGDAMSAIIGFNPLEEFKGTYTTEMGAAKKLRANGCENVQDVFANYLGLEPVNRLQAQIGDVGVTLINGELTAGYYSPMGFVVKSPSGLAIVDILEVIEAYKVGKFA